MDKNKECKQKHVKNKNKRNILRIGTWNVRSLAGKLNELTHEMEQAKLDYLAITETKKKEKGMTQLHNGYWMFWSGVEKQETAKGGVGIIVKEDKIKNVSQENLINERLMSIDIRIEGEEELCTLIVVYAPNDNASKEEKTRFFEELQKEIDDKGNNIIVMGDLNGRVGNHNTGIEWCLGNNGEKTRNANGKLLIDLCLANELIIGNTKFNHKEIHKITREEPTKQEESIIDYFLVNKNIWKRVKNIKVRRGAEIGSDHYLLKMDLIESKGIKAENKRSVANKKIKTHKLKEKVNQEKYQQLLETNLRAISKETHNLDDMWEQLKNNILDAATLSCGIDKVSNDTRKKSAWWSTEIKNLIKQKKEKWKTYLQSKDPEDYEEYKVSRKIVSKKVKEEKEKAWIDFGKKMERAYKENQKLFYGTIKQMRKKKHATLKNIKDENGKIITHEDKIMERWKQYFQKLLSSDDNYYERQTSRLAEETKKNIRETRKKENTHEITMDELEFAIRKMKIGKAPGHDNITSEMIKYAGEYGKEKLRLVLNKALESEKVPQDWQTGIIIPIYKKGDSRECANYRGITLLSVVGKLYARILERRIRETLEETLEDSQYGFRANRGVQDPIFTLRQICEKALKTSSQIHICFIDLIKAFDRVKREDIWNILKKRNIKESLIKNIKSLYANPLNYVRTKNEKSDMFRTKDGLRQGCVLSPLLFALILDEAIKTAKTNIKEYFVGRWKMENIYVSELCFADDMVIIAADENTLQHNLDHYNKQLKEMNMAISTEKTKTMIVSKERKQHNIKINEEKIEQVARFKYLGSIFTEDGKIDEEISERAGAAGRLFNSIKTDFLNKKEIPSDVKVEVFKKVAVPTLTYASESWTTTEMHRSKIRSAEMRFLRKIDGKNKLDKIRNEKFREKLGTKPVEITIEEGQLRWLGHIYRMGEDKIAKRVFEARTQKKVKPGRPRKTWQQEAREASEKRGVKWEEIGRLTKDRTRWKEIWKSKPA